MGKSTLVADNDGLYPQRTVKVGPTIGIVIFWTV